MGFLVENCFPIAFYSVDFLKNLVASEKKIKKSQNVSRQPFMRKVSRITSNPVSLTSKNNNFTEF